MNPATNQIYVANVISNNVTVINGVTNATATVADPNAVGPTGVAVNPVTNLIYVANGDSNNVTVINGTTNATITVADPNAAGSYFVAVSSTTNQIYVPNYISNNVTVINGTTNATTTVTDPNAIGPWHIAVNTASNKVYVANYLSSNITVIDGITDSTTTVTDGNASQTIDVAVNPVTGRIYAPNFGSSYVTAIAEQQVQSIPVKAVIQPLPGNQTQSTTPTFSFTTSDSFKPNATIVNNLLFQADTWQGPWRAAKNKGAGKFQGQVATPLQFGVHVLYAYATDGQDTSSTSTGEHSDPLLGNIAPYVFLVY